MGTTQERNRMQQDRDAGGTGAQMGGWEGGVAAWPPCTPTPYVTVATRS